MAGELMSVDRTGGQTPCALTPCALERACKRVYALYSLNAFLDILTHKTPQEEYSCPQIWWIR